MKDTSKQSKPYLRIKKDGSWLVANEHIRNEDYSVGRVLINLHNVLYFEPRQDCVRVHFARTSDLSIVEYVEIDATMDAIIGFLESRSSDWRMW